MSGLDGSRWWLPRTNRGWLLVGAVCVGLVLAVALPVFAMGRMMMGTRPASEAQLDAAAVGDQVDVALEIITAPDAGPLTATVLERADQGGYRRAGRTLRVSWGPATEMIMGRASDVRSGAIVQARGRLAASDLLEADRLVILTGSVEVR